MAWSKDNSNDALLAADEALLQAKRAEVASEYIDEKKPLIDEFTGKQTNLQAQINQLVIEGDSSPAAAQASVGSDGTIYPTLKARLDKENNSVTAQLADTINYGGKEILGVPSNYLDLPSTLADGLTTHPSVIDFKTQFDVESWNGYRYWMAHTPYPEVKNENPSIACSNDNKNWALPTGAPNPLVPAPSKGYNSDTEMIFISETNKLRIYYRQYGFDANIQIYFIESSNGVVWSSPVLAIDESSIMLSPSIIKTSSDDYRMWYVVDENNFGYRTSTDGIVWSSEILQSQPWLSVGIWHIGISKDSNGKYHLLGSAYPTVDEDGVQYRPIYYAYSEDGQTWVANETPQIIPTGWASGYLYRPSFIVDESKGLKNGLPYVKVWFSASDALGNWHIGYTEGYLQNHDDETLSSANRQRKNTHEAFNGLFGIIKSGIAKINHLFAGKITIKNPFSQPMVDFRDDRKTSPEGNRASIQWSADNTDDSNRFKFVFSKNGEAGVTKFQISPFSNWVGFASPGSLANIKEINTIGQAFQIVVRDKDNISKIAMKWDPVEKAWNFQNLGLQGLSDVRTTRLITYNDGVRVYKQNDATAFYNIRTDGTGALIIDPPSDGLGYFKFREDGDIQAVSAGIMDLEYTNYAPQTSRPGSLNSTRPGVYVADGVTHDPINLASGKPYLVFWNGTDYTKIG